MISSKNYRLSLGIILAGLLVSKHSFAKPQGQEKIVFIGDSITAGYGLKKSDSYPHLVEKEINLAKPGRFAVINAGISGSTTASGLSRLKWQIKAKPELLVLALGANDGLRGTPLSEVQNNLEKTIKFAKSMKLKILLVGMKVPPNYGVTYSNDFEKVFSDLAKKHQIPFMPFLLLGVAGDKTLNQADAIHPNKKGQEIIAKNILPYLKRLLP